MFKLNHKLADETGENFVAISAIDGRYRKQVAPLADFFSESALNRMRIFVETSWVLALCEGLPEAGFEGEQSPAIEGLFKLNDLQKNALTQICENFNADSIKRISQIESKTQHDVKAIEYFIDEELERSNAFSPEELSKIVKAVHFCCTSEDINNLSYALCLKEGIQQVWKPKLEELIKLLAKTARENVSTPLLAKTHGQPATPTTLGKEIAVFVHRLTKLLGRLETVEFAGKINGATGTFGAHVVAVPELNWPKFAKNFVENRLGLTYNPLTTQIENHDFQAEIYNYASLIGTVLTNLAVDFWMYISAEVFVQIPVEGATGSSTMPHKVNPIKFENAEANLEIADALFSKLASTLPISRLQRDLTDSSSQRNIGSAFAHSLLAIDNLISGVSRLKVNTPHLLSELNRNAAVLAEPIQSVMRAEGIKGTKGMDNPYERLKELTRGNAEITLESLREFVKTLSLPSETEKRLLDLTPETYLGVAEEIATEILNNSL